MTIIMATEAAAGSALKSGDLWQLQGSAASNWLRMPAISSNSTHSCLTGYAADSAVQSQGGRVCIGALTSLGADVGAHRATVRLDVLSALDVVLVSCRRVWTTCARRDAATSAAEQDGAVAACTHGLVWLPLWFFVHHTAAETRGEHHWGCGSQGLGANFCKVTVWVCTAIKR